MNLRCEKHNCDLECMAGRNAHRSNWYCAVCDKEEDFLAVKQKATEAMLRFNLFCCDISDVVVERDVHDTNKLLIAEFHEAYNPWQNYEQLAVVVERLMNDDDEEAPYDLMQRVGVLGFFQAWRDYVCSHMGTIDTEVEGKNYELLMEIRDALDMELSNLLTDKHLEVIIGIAQGLAKEHSELVEGDTDCELALLDILETDIRQAFYEIYTPEYIEEIVVSKNSNRDTTVGLMFDAFTKGYLHEYES